MSFHEPAFIFLILPIAIIIMALAKKPNARIYAAIGVSSAYYCLVEPNNFLLLVAMCVGNSIFLKIVRNIEFQQTRRRLANCAVIINLLPLVLIKYADPSIAQKLGQVVVTDAVMPLGISFYTFQIILLYTSGDFLKREVTAVDFVAFISFFPQLILGPIQKFQELVPQLKRPSYTKLSVTLGVLTVALALFKKRVMAQSLADMISGYSSAFDQSSFLTTFDAWQYILANAAFIYFDFSAYADLAVGVGLLLGVKLIDGFKSPFRSNSVSDFWRGWNVSLMRFFRESIYIPITNGRRGGAAQVGGIMAVMIACGVWHGPSSNFVIWGAAVGVLIAAEKYISGKFANARIPTVFRRAWVLIAFVMPLAIFLTKNIDDAVALLISLLGLNHPNYLPAHIYTYIASWPGIAGMFVPVEVSFRASVLESAWLIACWLLIFFAPSVANIRERLANFFNNCDSRRNCFWTLLLNCVSAIIGTIALMVAGQATGFFYFQF